MALTTSRGLALAAVALAALAAVLAYLRDPPWLHRTSHGFHGQETDPAGRTFRWTTGHASFFVPADAVSVGIPLAGGLDTPGHAPVTTTITIDDRPAERLELTDEAWRTVVLRLPPPGGRRTRRIDLRVDRTHPGERGVRVGEIRIRNSAAR
jgi:hypothetical protein